MIVKNSEDRQAYEDRLKVERDEWARIGKARLEKKLEGTREGKPDEWQERWLAGWLEGCLEVKLEERVRFVKILRDLVGDDHPSAEQLAAMDLEDLAKHETELYNRLRDRI